MFDKELASFIANQDDLVAKHRGKVLVIRGERVEGAYESPLAAYAAAEAPCAAFDPAALPDPCRPKSRPELCGTPGRPRAESPVVSSGNSISRRSQRRPCGTQVDQAHRTNEASRVKRPRLRHPRAAVWWSTPL